MKELITNPDNRRKLIICSIVAVALLFCIILAVILLNRPERNFPTPEIPFSNHFLVFASDEGPAGVEPTSLFIIQSDEDQDINYIRDRISTIPEIEYELTSRGSREFLLEPKEQLSPNTVYNVALRTDDYAPLQTWAFQTKNTFFVSGVFPRDKAQEVPVDSGIEIRFSQPIPGDASQYFSISPPVSGNYILLKDNTLIFTPENILDLGADYSVTLAKGLASLASDTLEEDYSFSFRTQYKTQEVESAEIYEYNKMWETFTSTDPVQIGFHANKQFEEVNFKTSVYRFGNLSEYLSAVKNTLDKRSDLVDTEKLSLLYSFDTKLIFTGDNSYWDPSYFELPENPGFGWYLIDMRTEHNGTDSENSGLGGRQLQRLIQISDVSVYNLSTATHHLFWLNNANTKSTLTNAELTIGDLKTKTDENGLAVLTRPEPKESDLEENYKKDYEEFRIKTPAMEYGDFLYTSSAEKIPLSDLYYTYVYTDRELYQPTDKIHFYGMILPRGEKSVRPAELYLDWKDGGKYPDGIKVKVEADGSFKGEIDVEKHNSGWFYLEFYLEEGGENLTYKDFSIMEYEKPAYTVSDSVDKSYYRKGDKVNVQLEGAFFDGTPASGLSFGLNSRNADFGQEQMEKKNLILDKNGCGSASFSLESFTDWRPVTKSIYYDSTGAESTSIHGAASVKYFPSDYMVKLSAERRQGSGTKAGDSNASESSKAIGIAERKEGSGTNPGDSSASETSEAIGIAERQESSGSNAGDSSVSEIPEAIIISINAYAIDFSKVNGDEYSYDVDEYGYNEDDYKALEGSRAEFTGTAQVIETEYIKTNNGSYYDFVNKRVVDTYYYKSEEHPLESYPVESSGGAAVLELPGYPDTENKRYRIELNCRMPDGSALKETSIVPSANFNSYDRYSKGDSYYFRNAIEDEEYNGYDDYRYSLQKYGAGENVSLKLVNEERGEPAEGRFLYIILGNGILENKVIDNSNFYFNFPFESRYAPNIEVVGAYFNNGHIYAVTGCDVRYKFDERALSLELQPSKGSYRPGEDVTATLTVKDQSGKPVQANYLLSVADEAAFAVFDQNARPLNEIYKMFYYSYTTLVSFTPLYLDNGGAEYGDGGGDDAIRRNFVDTAAFISGETDVNGHATVHFKLPDNMTSWRLTGLAYTEEYSNGVNLPKIGKVVQNVPATLLFFINAVTNTNYIAGDSIGLTLRSAGTALSSEDIVSYELVLSGDGVEKRQSVQGAAGDFIPVNFGLQKQGSYKLLIRASYGNYSDAIEKEIFVKDSLLQFTRFNKGELAEGVAINAVRFPVQIMLYDMENELFYEIMNRLMYAQGGRADQILAMALAKSKWASISGESGTASNTEGTNTPLPDDAGTGAKAGSADAGIKGKSERVELDIDPNELSQWGQGLRMWPYAETDPLLTAKAAVTMAEYLDADALREYFNRIINNENSSSGDVAAAYFGLGALKSPVLFDLRKVIEDKESFSFRERLQMAIGLAAIGDKTGALDWYTRNVTNGAEYFVRDEIGWRYAEEVPDVFEITAELAMLTALLGISDAYHFNAYLMDYYVRAYDPLPELMVWLRFYEPRPSQSAYGYQLNGESISGNFEKARFHFMELGEAQLAAANLKTEKGRVGYHAVYTADLQEAKGEGLYGFTISRTLSSHEIKLGDELEVTTVVNFAGDAVIGGYIVDTIVPSGFRFVSAKSLTSVHYRLGESGNIRFFISPVYQDGSTYSYGQDPLTRTMPETVSITYRAKAVLPGDYVVEADAYTCAGSAIPFATDRDTVRVVQ